MAENRALRPSSWGSSHHAPYTVSESGCQWSRSDCVLEDPPGCLESECQDCHRRSVSRLTKLLRSGSVKEKHD